VKKAIVRSNSDQELVTEPLRIYSPLRYKRNGLVTVGEPALVWGVHAIVTEDGRYAVRNINARLPINYTHITEDTIDDEEYMVFHIAANSVMIPNTRYNKDDVLIYYFFDELFFQGHRPWYLNYDDIGNVIQTANVAANSPIGKDRVILQILTAHLGRSASDLRTYYRHTDTSKQEMKWVGLSSISLAVEGTFNKIIGNYMSKGITSALANPSSVVTPQEKILRS
jgi:hypothetical protein